MARLDDLEFRITASTAQLSGDLARGSKQIEQFASRTGAHFTTLGNRFTMVAGRLRGIFALFGVGFGVRALSRWVSSAFEIDKLTASQAERLKGIKSSMDLINQSAESMTRTIGFKMLPYLERAAGFWAAIAERSDPSNVDNKMTAVNEELTRKMEALIGFRTGKLAPSRGTVDQAIAALEAEIAVLHAARSALEDAVPEPSRRLEEWKKQMAELQDIQVTPGGVVGMRERLGMTTMPGAPFKQEDLTRAQQLTAEMATDVEQQQAAWEEINRLHAIGAGISDETLRRFDEQQLKPIEVTRHALKKFESESERVAKAIGENFRDAFAGWIAGADHDFRSLLKNMAAQMIASGIFKALGSMFAGKTGGAAGFFSSFFGGGRAMGGPVSAGGAYTVGEHGPETLVMGGRSGMIAAGGGGVNVSMVYNIDARGADSSLIARLPMILAENRERTKAEIRHEQSRRRF